MKSVLEKTLHANLVASAEAFESALGEVLDVPGESASPKLRASARLLQSDVKAFRLYLEQQVETIAVSATVPSARPWIG